MDTFEELRLSDNISSGLSDDALVHHNTKSASSNSTSNLTAASLSNSALSLVDLPVSVWVFIAPHLFTRAVEALRLTCRAATHIVDSQLLRTLRLHPTVPWLLRLQCAGCTRLLTRRFSSLRVLFLRPASAKDYVNRIDLTACFTVLGPCPCLRALHLSGWPVPYQAQLYGMVPAFAPALTSLILEGAAGALTDAAVRKLADLSSLRRLAVRYGPVYEHKMPYTCPNLGALTQLTALQLVGAVPNQATAAALEPLTGLAHLHLELLHDGYDKGMQVLDLRKHTQLTSLTLRARPVWQLPERRYSHGTATPQLRNHHSLPCPAPLRLALQRLPPGLRSLAVDLPPWRPRPDAAWPTSPTTTATVAAASAAPSAVPCGPPALQFLACPPDFIPCLQDSGLNLHGLICLRLSPVPAAASRLHVRRGGGGGGGGGFGVGAATEDGFMEDGAAATPPCGPYCCGGGGRHQADGGREGCGSGAGECTTVPNQDFRASSSRTSESAQQLCGTANELRAPDPGQSGVSAGSGLVLDPRLQGGDTPRGSPGAFRKACGPGSISAAAAAAATEEEVDMVGPAEAEALGHLDLMSQRQAAVPAAAALVASTEEVRELYGESDVIAALRCLPAHLLRQPGGPSQSGSAAMAAAAATAAAAAADGAGSARSGLRHLEINVRLNTGDEQLLLQLLQPLSNPPSPGLQRTATSGEAGVEGRCNSTTATAAAGATAVLGCGTGVTLDLCLSVGRNVSPAALVRSLSASTVGEMVRHLTLMDLDLSYSSYYRGDTGGGIRSSLSYYHRHGIGSGNPDAAITSASASAAAASAAPWAGESELVGHDSVNGTAAVGDVDVDVRYTDIVTTAICSRTSTAAAAAAATALQETRGSYLHPSPLTPARLELPALSLLAAVCSLPQLRTLTLQPVRNMLGVLCMLAEHPALRVLRLLDVEEDGAHAAERPLLPRLRMLVLALGNDPWVTGGVSGTMGFSVPANVRSLPVGPAGGRGPVRGCTREYVVDGWIDKHGERVEVDSGGSEGEGRRGGVGTAAVAAGRSTGLGKRKGTGTGPRMLLLVPQLLAWEVEVVNREAEAETGGKCECELIGGGGAGGGGGGCLSSWR